jgi:hypothetical protein
MAKPDCARVLEAAKARVQPPGAGWKVRSCRDRHALRAVVTVVTIVAISDDKKFVRVDVVRSYAT